jgi:hypothetical protein
MTTRRKVNLTLVFGLMVAMALALVVGVACGPPPDGWQGAGRQYAIGPPPMGGTTGDSGADSAPASPEGGPDGSGDTALPPVDSASGGD